MTDVRAVLLTGEGKAFSAGGDLNEVVSLQADVAKRMRMCEIGQRIIQALIDIQVPVVVALHGDAMGLGASVALGGDIIVACKTARIGDPHVKVGLVAGDGGVLFWPASMGMHRARRYLLTGDLLPAEEAWRFGLVTDLTETPEECAALAREARCQGCRLAAHRRAWHEEIPERAHEGARERGVRAVDGLRVHVRRVGGHPRGGQGLQGKAQAGLSQPLARPWR